MLLAALWPDNTPIMSGMIRIIRSSDILINDYIAVGGVRATFINAALVGLVGYGLLLVTRTPISGPTIAGVLTMTGFAMFGKNVFNVGPIILGVYLYSLFQRENFRHYVIIAMFGTCLAPIVSQFSFGYGYGVPIGALIGVAIGFLMPEMIKHLLHNHQGYQLYNIGFTAGFIGTVVASQIKGFGGEADLQMIWSTEHNQAALAVIFVVYLASLILLGVVMETGCWRKMARLIRYPGTLVTDFVSLEGLPVTLVNMGLVGLIGLGYILLVGGNVNGPTLGALLTMVGFGAFGKHPLNITPLMLGVFGGAVVNAFSPADPGPLLAGLFVTGIAPISGTFGPLVGVLAGFLHLSLAMHVGWLHGGFNLYNNGFAGGLVAMVIVTTARSLRRKADQG